MSWLWNGKTDGRVDVIARTKQTRTKDVRHQYRASRRHCWMLCYGIFAAIAKRGNKNSNLYIKVTPQKRMQIIRATLASSPTRPLFGQQFYMSHNFTISGTFHLQPFMLDVPSPFRRPVCHPDPYSWVLVAASATLSFFWHSFNDTLRGFVAARKLHARRCRRQDRPTVDFERHSRGRER